jgi:small subunit ribosomal protein S1
MSEQQQESSEKGFAQVLDEFEKDQQSAAVAAAAAAVAAGETPAPALAAGEPKVGQKVKGKVLSVTEDSIFVDLGAKSDAVLPAAEVKDKEGKITVAVGDEIEATVAGTDAATGTLTLRKRAGGRGAGRTVEIGEEIRQAFALGLPLEGTVTGFNKGGAEVKIGSGTLRAFCPSSQLDVRRVEDPASFAGQKLSFKVLRIEEAPGKRPNVVLSRRALLEEESAARASEARGKLKVGQVVRGKVSSIQAYGAFVDLGGVEGLLHVSEISHSRTAHPNELLKVGEEVEVQILKIESGAPAGAPAAPAAGSADGKGRKPAPKTERISLSRRSLEKDPWRDAAARFPEGTEVKARITRLETFGAFVELAPGLEGLLHVSELPSDGRRLKHARDAAQLGQELEVRVSKIELDRRRVSLALVREDQAEPAAVAKVKATNPPATFGAMADFFARAQSRGKRT